MSPATIFLNTFLVICLTKYVSGSVPPKLGSMFSNEVEEGDSISLLCNVLRGSEPLTFSWFKNDQPLALSPGLSIDTKGKMSMFKFESIKASDAGDFSCVVKNDAGSDSSSAQLKVSG